MHELYILGNGIAIPHGTPGVPEDERPLTPKGEKRIKEVGRGLAASRARCGAPPPFLTYAGTSSALRSSSATVLS